MKVKDLIKQLQEVDGNNSVFMYGRDALPYDFSGVSYDDNSDVVLYVTGDDEAV